LIHHGSSKGGRELNELWVIYALSFGAAMLSIQAGYMMLFRERKAQQSINRRLKLGSQGESPTDVFQALKSERGFADFDNAWTGRLSDFWTQTGLRFNRNVLLLAICGLAVLYFFAFSFPLGGMAPLSLVLAVFTAPLTVFFFVHFVRKRRIKRFSEQFPDTLDVIVRGVRVGLPFTSALNLVAREMPDPVGTEFGMTSDEISFGLEMSTALHNLQRRVGQEDLLYFVIAISIQSQTGGKLAEVLTRLSRLIRQRAMLRLKVRALSAEGRMSGYFLSAMPFLLFGIISLMSPNYFTSVQDHPLIPPALALGLGALLIGNVMMYRMINFKY
jgi:tight adherence protein B